MEKKEPKRSAWDLAKRLLGFDDQTFLMKSMVSAKTWEPKKRRKQPTKRTGAKGRRRARAKRRSRQLMAKASRKANRAAGILLVIGFGLGCAHLPEPGPAPDGRVEAAREAQERMRHRRIERDIEQIRDERQ